MSPFVRKPRSCGWIRRRTRIFGSRCYGVMAGDVNRAARCRIWRFTTNSFAASLGMIQKKT